MSDFNFSIFDDILKGYNKFKYSKYCVYYKHPHIEDVLFLEAKKKEEFEKAKAFDIPTEEEKLIYLNENKLWTAADEKKIKDLNIFISGMYKSREKMYLDAQIEVLDKQISNSEKEKQELLNKKNELMGLTCENYADTKIVNHTIFYLFFKDKQFRRRFFTYKEFDNCESEVFDFFLNKIIEFRKTLKIYNIKKLALSSIFFNYYQLADNDPLKLFGKPIFLLSDYQVELFRYGRYYLSIFERFSDAIKNVPRETLEDPDKFEEWFKMSKAGEEMMSRAEVAANKTKPRENTRMGIVGATSKDLKRFGGTQMSTEEIEKDINQTFHPRG